MSYIFHIVPPSNEYVSSIFNEVSWLIPGYYADPSAECQVFHICTADGNGGLAKYSFLCPNGTIFNQNYFICDWWFNFDCSEAETLYSLNDDIAAERDAAAGAGALDSYGAASEARASYGGPIDEARSDYGASEVIEDRLPGRNMNYWNRFLKSVVFKRGQKMALKAPYVIICPQVLWTKKYNFWKQLIRSPYYAFIFRWFS